MTERGRGMRQLAGDFAAPAIAQAVKSCTAHAMAVQPAKASSPTMMWSCFFKFKRAFSLLVV